MLLQCTDVAFKNHLESLKSWFENRGYPKTLADNQLKHATETKNIWPDLSGVMLHHFTYHPQLKDVNDIIKKDLVFLYAKEQVKNIFIHLLLLFHFVKVLVLESIWWEFFSPTFFKWRASLFSEWLQDHFND